ncbi:DUF1646 family protein [Clostridium paridis]|uniref:DUF1646 family protein n=1 Tax=Clostridium paridis TaxID=2803863 RepID=A0A937FG01_9CLOT|nr:DUF1646 family protein [Clostridium paridis]MBL4932498.1 DUF1646 family protein [Clostridium paridis]
MFIFLVLLLLLTLFLPLLSKSIEHHLEIFLFVIGILSSVLSGILTINFVLDILKNEFLYLISITVLAGGIIFKLFYKNFQQVIYKILRNVSIQIFIFLMIVILGLISSIITAIIASLILVEIISLLPLNRDNKIIVNVLSCFSIGLGSVLTPIGEPLSTIVTSKLNANFFFIFNLIGSYIIPMILALGVLGACTVKTSANLTSKFSSTLLEDETYMAIIVRVLKVFIFIISLELLGASFKPIIDTYLINLNIEYIYIINISSAILDNATLASAEISSLMTPLHIKTILLSLLISGGMMIQGNIPNIISANKLKIKSSEWICVGFPLGFFILLIFYIIMFVI